MWCFLVIELSLKIMASTNVCLHVFFFIATLAKDQATLCLSG